MLKWQFAKKKTLENYFESQIHIFYQPHLMLKHMLLLGQNYTYVITI